MHAVNIIEKKSYLLIYAFNYSKLIIISKNTAENMTIFN